MYRVLETGTVKLDASLDYEFRLYEPIRRTISVNRKSHFVQFPSMIFARRGAFLFAVFANEDDGELKIYPVPLPNVYDDGSICLCEDWYDEQEDEYYNADPNDDWETTTNMDLMVARFWESNFNDWLGYYSYNAYKHWFGSFANWKKLSLHDVEKTLDKFDNFTLANLYNTVTGKKYDSNFKLRKSS